MTVDIALASALVLLGVLLTALLSANRDLTRRVERLEIAAQRRLAVAEKPSAAPVAAPADSVSSVTTGPEPDLVGVTPAGEPIGIDTGVQTTLLSFLSSTCTTCRGFFQAFGAHSLDDVAPGARLVVVTKSDDDEDAAAIGALAPAGVTVVMSSEAWNDFEVPLPPYFLLLHEGEVLTEGPASGWQDLTRMVAGSLGRARQG